MDRGRCQSIAPPRSVRRKYVLGLLAAACIGELCLGSVCAWSADRILFAVPNSPEDALREIHKGLVARDEQLNPVWVRFRVTRQESAEWMRGFGGGKAADERRWEAEGEYARKGEKVRTRTRLLAPEPASDWAREQTFLYNGEIEVRPAAIENMYLLSRKWEKLQAIEQPLEITGENTLRALLQNWIEGKEKFTRVSAAETERQDGKRVFALEWYNPEKWRFRLQVLPDDGWALKRWESFDERKEFVDRCEVEQFETVSGIVLPKTGRAEHYMKGNVLGTSTHFAVESVETQASRVPDSLFQYEFPPDAVLYDMDNKVSIRSSVAAESYLAEIVRRLGPPRRQWLKWVGVVAGGFGLLIAGGAAVRWRRRRGRLPQTRA